MKRISVVLLLVLVLFILEPVFKEKLTFAVTPFDNSGLSLNLANSGIKGAVSFPEGSPLILFLGGMIGIIVRFVRRSFGKFKRYSDLLLSTFGLLVISPLLIIAAVLIKLTSPGPVIYKQDRVGKGGRIFKIYKLRSMRPDAEKGTGAVWAAENDPRVTKIGKILRKSRIDEIPQFFNVIKGEMSIIGPRPERPEMVRDFKHFIRDYEKRLQVNPGITGLAQIYHRYDETIDDVKKKIKYDLLYIRRMCLLADLDILARSFVVVLTGKGAR